LSGTSKGLALQWIKSLELLGMIGTVRERSGRQKMIMDDCGKGQMIVNPADLSNG
jgi:hypothetical protein